MSRYVSRNVQGAVDGDYRNPNPRATELIDDNHPELVAWRAARSVPPAVNPLLARMDALEAENVALKERVAAVERAR